MSKTYIDTGKLNESFEEHIVRNKSIFFTGQYGIGKTTFLKDFFKKRASDFDVYYLTPVRYQLHHNEDVIDLLKYDILMELLKVHSDAFSDNRNSSFFRYRCRICKKRRYKRCLAGYYPDR